MYPDGECIQTKGDDKPVAWELERVAGLFVAVCDCEVVEAGRRGGSSMALLGARLLWYRICC